MRPLHPCVCCGEPTHFFLPQETADGSRSGVSICAECISIWLSNPQARQLLLSSRQCWGGDTIRRLLRPAGCEAPEERPPAAGARPRLASGQGRGGNLS